MPDAHSNSQFPTLPLGVHLAPALGESLAERGVVDRLSAQLQDTADEFLRLRGIPALPSVSIHASKGSHDLICLREHDRLRRCDPALLADLYGFTCRRLLPSDLSPAELGAALVSSPDSKLQPEPAASAAEGQLIEFVTLGFRELLHRSSAALLGPAELEAYWKLLALDWPDIPSAAILSTPLETALKYGLSLARTSEIADALRCGLADKHDPFELAEDVIARLQPGKVEIRFAPGYLRALTENPWVGKLGGILASMRESLFHEMGVTFPDLQLVTDPELPPNTFAFKLNDMVISPRVGLETNRCLTDYPVEQLEKLGLHALGTVMNPATRQPVALLDVSNLNRALESGLMVWTPLGYIVLCLSGELVRAAGGLLARSEVEGAVEQLSRWAPTLVVALREQLSSSRFSAVLRVLLDDGISARNLPTIMQALLDCDYVVADELRHIVFDDRFAFQAEPAPDWKNNPVVLAEVTRRSLKRYIGFKHTRGQPTLRTFLLDPNLEALLSRQTRGAPPLHEELREQIIGVARSRIASADPSRPVAVLTTTPARRLFQELMRDVLPKLPVLAYQELALELSIEPLERISLS